MSNTKFQFTKVTTENIPSLTDEVECIRTLFKQYPSTALALRIQMWVDEMGEYCKQNENSSAAEKVDCFRQLLNETMETVSIGTNFLLKKSFKDTTQNNRHLDLEPLQQPEYFQVTDGLTHNHQQEEQTNHEENEIRHENTESEHPIDAEAEASRESTNLEYKNAEYENPTVTISSRQGHNSPIPQRAFTASKTEKFQGNVKQNKDAVARFRVVLSPKEYDEVIKQQRANHLQ